MPMGSILPGWAYNKSRLPPWYGPGGARNPAPNSPSGGAMSPSIGQPPRHVRAGNVRSPGDSGGGFSGSGMTPRTGPVTNTAPTNPWITGNQGPPPIYNEDMSGELKFIDRLIQELERSKGNSRQNFQDRLNQIGSTPIERISPEEKVYKRSDDFADAIAKIKELSETGGFSSQDLASIRARGVSPIRAVYGNAQRNLERQRALQGGYAPGIGAATSRMARELSEQLASASTGVEADIADRVQRGKMAGIDRLGALTADENRMINETMGGNVDTANLFEQENARTANEAALQRERLRESVYGSEADERRSFADQLAQLTGLRQNVLEGNRSGRLRERELNNRGTLDWEQLNQRGGMALIDALMREYGGR